MENIIEAVTKINTNNKTASNIYIFHNPFHLYFYKKSTNYLFTETVDFLVIKIKEKRMVFFENKANKKYRRKALFSYNKKHKDKVVEIKDKKEQLCLVFLFFIIKNTAYIFLLKTIK